MYDIYRISLSSPLGIKYGSLQYAEDGRQGDITLSLFGYESRMNAQRDADESIKFNGSIRFITGSRPCTGEFRITDKNMTGKLILRGISIPFKGILEEREDQHDQ